jgi:hypothetical protein
LSGYGGQPPGWQDPYGQSGWDPQGDYSQQSWQDPYGQQGYGYGPPGVPYRTAGSGWAVGALVCNILVGLFCCNPIAIAGIVTSAIAMNKNQAEPESAHKLTIWSWVIAVTSFVLSIAGYVILFLLGVWDQNNSPTYSNGGF